ncbi:MAG: hypothetical protein OJF50_006746 [Nitrospira sp.]|jgi:hypothetical protein|nr:hypothetical protein [Nitrospira sp.]
MPHQPSDAFPEPYLSTEVSDRLIQQILDAFNREGLTSEQARWSWPVCSSSLILAN